MNDAVAADATRRVSRLSPDLVLHRVPNVSLTLSAADTITIKAGSGKVICGRLGLRVLERFARPATVGEVAAQSVSGAQQWMDLMDTIALLVDHGVLYDVSEGPPGGQPRRSYWWDNPRPHIQMLDDVERTNRFIAAIEAHGNLNTVAAVAEAFDRSERWVQQLFRDYAGIGLKWLLQRHRLLAAARRIRESEKPDWADIAYEFGYASQQHFNTDFRKVLGRTPMQYKKVVTRRQD
jgi:AraC-like DNA-binding protein